MKHFKNTHTLTNNNKINFTESQKNNVEISKRYKCDYCKNKFATSSNLSKHQKNCKAKSNADKCKEQIAIIETLTKEIEELKKNNNNLTIKGNNYNISINNYVKKTFPDALALLALDDYSVTEKDDDGDLTDSLFTIDI